MTTALKKKPSDSEISLALCLEVGDAIITPCVTRHDSNQKTWFTGSLNDDDFIQYLENSEDKPDLNLATLLDNFDIVLEESLAKILDVTVSHLEFGWYPEECAGWLQVTTDYLSVTLFSTKNVDNDAPNKTGHTVLSIASTYQQNLAEIMPLVDTQSLPNMQLKNASIIYASSQFDSSIIIDNYLPDDLKGCFSSLPTPGFSIAAEVELDDLTIPLVLPLHRSTAKSQALAETTNRTKAATTASTTDLDNTPQSSNTSATVGRSLGPVTVNGLGLAYQGGELILSMDGALNLSNFQMYLLDMNLKLNVNELMTGDLDGLSFDLSGLYLDLQTSGFSLNGGFLRKTIDDGHGSRDEYLGQLSLKTKAFSLTALGIYSQLNNGDHSLFAYLALNTPIGGDPAFFVEGLALGFGYNRDVLVPPVNEVNQFPLVTALGEKDKLIGGAGDDDSDALVVVRERFDALSKYLPAVSGQYLVCAGLHVNTYKQVDSIAVLMVEFGQSLGIHLVGTSEMRLPQGVPNAVVAIEMAYRMSFDMAEGVVSLEAQLTDNSYVLSRRCRLTGGFAFCSWFSGENKGDFVVSMGGYHPLFHVPDHYPVVPRLGFSWMITDSIYFKGEMYAALTPVAIMAGAGVSAYLTCGRVKAWFNADMNFIILWQPFHYQADFGISVGAEVTLGWGWFSKTFRTELYAYLDIYGPDFTGEAEVHWVIFSFSIAFGNASKTVDPITWSLFDNEYVPSLDKQIDMRITGGVREKNTEWQLIDPDNFELKIDSLIPRSQISLNGHDYFDDEKTINIAPMKTSLDEHEESTWTVNVEVTGSGQSTFVIKPENKRYPKAIWGEGNGTDISQEETTVDLLSGLRLIPEIKTSPGFTEALNASDFDFSELDKKDAFWQWGKPINSVICHQAEDNSDKIKSTLSSQAVTLQREKVAHFFDLNYTPTVDFMKNDLESAFIGTPLTRSVAL